MMNTQNVKRRRKKSSDVIDEQHYIAQGKLDNPNFSVFNRKIRRKELKKQQKQKKFDHWLTHKRKLSVQHDESVASQTEETKKVQSSQLEAQIYPEQNQTASIQVQSQQNEKQQIQQQIQKTGQENKNKAKIKTVDKISKSSNIKQKNTKKDVSKLQELEKQINQDDIEIKYYERLLGKKKNKSHQRRFQNEIKNDGIQDWFNLFDHVDNCINIKDINEYQPYKGEDDDIEEQKSNQDENQDNKDDNDNDDHENDNTDSDSKNNNDNDDEEVEVQEEDIQSESAENGSDQNDIMENEDSDDTQEDEMGQSQKDEQIEIENKAISKLENINRLKKEPKSNKVSKNDRSKIENQLKIISINSENKQSQTKRGELESSEIQTKKQKLEDNKQSVKLINQSQTIGKNQNYNQKEKEKEKGMQSKEDRVKRQEELMGTRRMELNTQEQQSLINSACSELEQREAETRKEVQKIMIRCFNRLSEPNIEIIFTDILKQFQNNPKNIVTPIFNQILSKFTLEHVKVSSQQISVNISLLTLIHDIFDNFVFAQFMKEFINKFQNLFEPSNLNFNNIKNQKFTSMENTNISKISKIGENKNSLENQDDDDGDNINEAARQRRNWIQIVCNLYIFGSLTTQFIKELIHKLLSNCANQEILDLLIFMISFVAHHIRDDSPLVLKNLISDIKDSIHKKIMINLNLNSINSQQQLQKSSPSQLQQLNLNNNQINTNNNNNNIFNNNNEMLSQRAEILLLNLNDVKLNKNLKSSPLERLNFLINWLKRSRDKFKITKKVFFLGFDETLSKDKSTNKWWEPVAHDFSLQQQQQQQRLILRNEEKEYLKNTNSSGVINDDFEEEQQQMLELLGIDENKRKYLEQMAVKYRMNTEIRKQIFVIVMSSEDYVDATQRLLKFKLNKRQKKEIPVVLLECCLMEKTYNPYYGLLAKKLCQILRKFSYCMNLQILDKYAIIDTFKLRKLMNLAKIIAFLAADGVLNLSVIKSFDFQMLTDHQKIFVKLFLEEYLDLIEPIELVNQVERTCQNKENYIFVESFKNYIKNGFKFDKKNIEHDQEGVERSKKRQMKLKILFQKLKMKEFDLENEIEQED